MSLHTYISEDVFLHLPELSDRRTPVHTILFFIPGNPGLLGYYREFLSLLTTSPPSAKCTIAGFSLGGFDVSPSDIPEALAKLQHPPTSPRGPIYSLRDQIDLTARRISALMHALDHPRCQILLIGHSVGAYIALEVIRRLHSQLDPGGGGGAGQRPSYAVAGAILLTPTVIDIAKSSHGRVVTPLLTYAPFADTLVQWAVWGMVGALPGGILEGLVGRVTGMKGEKLETTVRWLRSGTGVKQTVVMGGQEMREMGADSWGKEVWGMVDEMEEEEGRRWRGPKLRLYFARRDHWVSDVTREAIIKARGHGPTAGKEVRSWPRIEIEESGELVHGWCIEQSKQVAVKVQEWIQEIIQ